MHSTLVAWGYDPGFAHSFSSLARPDLTPARVVSDVGSQLEVIDPGGAPRPAVVAGRLRHEGATVVTGDWVAIDPAPTTAVVHHVLPRRTQLVRRAAGRAEAIQVVAANVDLLAIVTFSFYVRPLIGRQLWRLIHMLSFVLFALALGHGLYSGSDSQQGWVKALYWASGIIVLFLAIYRILMAATARAADEHREADADRALQAEA